MSAPLRLRAHPNLKKGGQYGGRPAVRYRHFPLSRSTRCLQAAEGEAAGAQGRVPERHELLFANKDRLACEI